MRIVGRTGSLFTRVALMFAEEAGIEYELITLDDLIATDLQRYLGNPALRIPVLLVTDEPLFGTRNICRVLAARAVRPLQVVWPEELSGILAMNAHEIVQHSMMTQVQLLMMGEYSNVSEKNRLIVKASAGLEASLRWLDENLAAIIAGLPPERTFALFEVEMYCLVEHLQFGPTVAIEAYPTLLGFAHMFAARESAQRTMFR